MAQVILKEISKKFGLIQVLSNVNLEINSGEFVSLLGPSGCGKTTLLRMIAGLETIDSGELLIDGKRYNDIPAQNRKIAMVFQSYALFPHMTVSKNIRFGLKINKTPEDEIKKKVEWAIELFGLKGLENRLPKEISGGQRQRVALARALVLNPKVLLLDEPLSNLDAALREMAMEELKRIHRQVGKTIIYVTHNQVEALSMSERIAVINQGKIEQYDTPRTIYDFPKTVFTASFVGSPVMNFFDGIISSCQDEIGIQTDFVFIKLDAERMEKLKSFKNKKVKVGIRPQNISYAEHHESKRASDTMIQVSIELLETQGDRSLVVSKTSSNIILRFMVSRDINIKSGEMVDVFLDGRRIHLFDPSTNINIFY